VCVCVGCVMCGCFGNMYHISCYLCYSVVICVIPLLFVLFRCYLCYSVVICVIPLLFVLFPCYLCYSVVICVIPLLFVLFYVLFVCECVLPLGDNPIAVNKYILSYHIISS